MKQKNNPKDVRKGCLLLSVIILIIFLSFIYTCNDEKQNDKVLTQQEKREQKIKYLLYFNGSKAINIRLTELIKRDLNDPQSFKKLNLSYVDKDSIIVVTEEFTAKNAFGGRLRKEVTIAIDTTGNIIKIISWVD